MKVNLSDNPVLWAVEFLKEKIFHEMKFYSLLIIAVLLIFFSERLLRSISYAYKKPYEYIQKIIDHFRTDAAIHSMKKNDDKLTQIKVATIKNIKNLSDKEKQYAAAQQLLEYPTPMGYCVLIKFIVKEENNIVRNNLLCAMHKNAKRCWYASIK